MICDPRLRTRGYGRLILESLPGMPVLEEQEQALDFIASLSADADPGARLEHREAAGV